MKTSDDDVSFLAIGAEPSAWDARPFGPRRWARIVGWIETPAASSSASRWKETAPPALNKPRPGKINAAPPGKTPAPEKKPRRCPEKTPAATGRIAPPWRRRAEKARPLAVTAGVKRAASGRGSKTARPARPQNRAGGPGSPRWGTLRPGFKEPWCNDPPRAFGARKGRRAPQKARSI